MNNRTFWFTVLLIILAALWGSKGRSELVCEFRYNPLSGRNEMICKENGHTTVCEEVYNPLNDTWELRCKEK